MSLDHGLDGALDAFFVLLPSIRNGNVEAIHDARVATRRLRSIVPLLEVVAPDDAWQPAERTLKRATRALGAARDIDVSLALADEIEARAPLFASPIAALRTELLRRQLRAHRKLIRRLEKLQFESLLDLRRRASAAARRSEADRAVASGLAEQADVVGRAIDRASGVYFARRSHTARVEIKKLRYLVELSDGCEASCKGLKLLKASQEALGRIHDREVLLHHLRRMDGKSGGGVATDGLIETLEAEIRTFYEKFLARRAEVAVLCAAIQRWAMSVRASSRRRRMLTVGAAALPSAAVVLLARRVAK